MLPVTINDDSISRLAYRLSSVKRVSPDWGSAPFLTCGTVDQIALYFFLGNSVNFRFWFSGCRDRYRYSVYEGSLAMWALLSDHFEGMSASFPAVSPQLETQLLGMPSPNERIRAIRETAEVLSDRFQGKVTRLFERARWHAPDIVTLIVEQFPGWRDESGGYQFRKRAQLFVWMVHSRLGVESPITGTERLSCFADYQLPKVLRAHGVLEYSGPLAAKVDAERLIPAGGEEEHAIRRCTVEAVERLCEYSMRCGPLWTLSEMDYHLWSHAGGLRGHSHHLAVTTAY